MKLVSVVVPNYNCEEYLVRCLDSILGQTYSNIEIIVCDNGSTDNSVDIINAYARRDKRIRVLLNPENIGLINTYNRMFFAAKGAYIAIQDSDDWCEPTRIEKQINILEQHNVGLCLTDSYYYSQIYPVSRNEVGHSYRINIKSEETWAPATIMFRQSILDAIPGFHPYFDRLTSYDRYFIMDIVHRFGGYYLDECLYHVWARPNSDHRSIDLSEARALKKLISEDIYNALKDQRMATGTDFLKDNDLAGIKAMEQSMLSDRTLIAEKMRRFACIQIDYGHFENAKHLLAKAIRLSPLYYRNYQSAVYYLRTKSKRGHLKATSISNKAT